MSSLAVREMVVHIPFQPKTKIQHTTDFASVLIGAYIMKFLIEQNRSNFILKSRFWSKKNVLCCTSYIILEVDGLLFQRKQSLHKLQIKLIKLMVYVFLT